MSKKKRSNFRSKVTGNAKKQSSQGASYGYLNLPKGIDVFSAEPGSKNVKFDIIPYVVTDPKHMDRDEESEIAVVDSLWYKKPFKTHRNIGVNRDAVICLATFGKKCPICEARAQRIKEGADKDETDALKPSLRNLYVIIPKGSKKHEEEPCIWDISQWLFQNLLNEELEEDEERGIFPDLEEGMTLKVRFDSKQIGKGNPFAEASRIDFLERDDQYEESILDDVPDLDDILNVLSYKELESKFFEMDDDDEDEEEEEKPKRKRKPIIKDEDEDDDEQEATDDEDEEEEEEKPRRSKTTRKKKTTKKEVADDDDDKDDGEEEKPKRKKKKTAKNKCPHGYRFGEDCDTEDECDDCDLWDACSEAQEAS